MGRIRDVAVGGVAGHMVMAVVEKMIAESRRHAIEHVTTYSHRDQNIDQIPFVKVYEDSGEGEETRGRINWNPAVYPEAGLHYWQIDRVIVQSDDNPEEKPGSTRRVVGLVFVRYPDSGPFRTGDGHGPNGSMRKFKVVLEYGYAENRNTYKFDSRVSDFKEPDPEDVALATV